MYLIYFRTSYVDAGFHLDTPDITIDSAWEGPTQRWRPPFNVSA